MIGARLFILQQEIELLWTDMRYARYTKPNGKPCTEVLGGLVTVCFTSTAETDLILQWMTKESQDETWQERDKMEKGEIRFYGDGNDLPPTKTYQFADAFLVYFEEVFNPGSDESLKTILTISPAIQNYGAQLVKSWSVSYVSSNEGFMSLLGEQEESQDPHKN